MSWSKFYLLQLLSHERQATQSHLLQLFAINSENSFLMASLDTLFLTSDEDTKNSSSKLALLNLITPFPYYLIFVQLANKNIGSRPSEVM